MLNIYISSVVDNANVEDFRLLYFSVNPNHIEKILDKLGILKKYNTYNLCAWIHKETFVNADMDIIKDNLLHIALLISDFTEEEQQEYIDHLYKMDFPLIYELGYTEGKIIF